MFPRYSQLALKFGKFGKRRVDCCLHVTRAQRRSGLLRFEWDRRPRNDEDIMSIATVDTTAMATSTLRLQHWIRLGFGVVLHLKHYPLRTPVTILLRTAHRVQLAWWDIELNAVLFGRCRPLYRTCFVSSQIIALGKQELRGLGTRSASDTSHASNMQGL